ncbi:MAG: amidohydrolase family protein [Bacteroidetes bacterium]|nr:amidohydrolase family protein [Bacteroidota bacterium]
MLETMLQLFLAANLLFAPAPDHGKNGEKKDVFAFVNVTVIPMTGERVLMNQTVVVEGDRIVAIGPVGDVHIPKSAMIIDGEGKFLIPGLSEMHGHIPPPTQSKQNIENVLFLYVANGITTVRGMLGYENQLELKERAFNGEIVSPNLYLAGPSFNGNSINSPEQAIQRVRAQVIEGWDLLKIHPGLKIEEYDAMAETAREQGIRFGGHVPADVGIEHAIEMGQETFDHLDGYVEYVVDEAGYIDENRLTDIVKRSKEAGIWVVPTMVLWETILGVGDLDAMKEFPELQYVSPRSVQGWVNAFERRVGNPDFDPMYMNNIANARMRILSELHQQGVRILMGTDAPQQFSVPGFSLHREMEKMVEAGMSPFEVLKSGSTNVGEYFQNEDDFGTIQVGQRADLVLLNADPLASVRNISKRSGVMVKGRWLSEEDIQDRLDEIRQSYDR